MPTVNKFLTLSFSGAGHLLPYHLGAASTIHKHFLNLPSSSSSESVTLSPPKSISGSSSGAIAATVFCLFPHLIEDYAERFITSRGRAMFHLLNIMNEHEMDFFKHIEKTDRASLHIATTRCFNGELQLFHFFSSPANENNPQSRQQQSQHLIKCLDASCKIPVHFHPFDVLAHHHWSSPPSYPEQDGIMINGDSFVDGGIAAPAPPTPLDSEEGAVRMVVSPISGKGFDNTNNNTTIRISPEDRSWRLLPMDIRCRGGFSIRPSVQNARALQVAGGIGSSTVLRDWFDRGANDADEAITSLVIE
ncbi:hypothetical protein ACHAXS_009324 [Conticribra weissflogii]